MNVEPLHFLTFPVVLGASTSAAVSPGSRQSCAPGGKGVGLLWKGKLSPGRREGDAECRPSHLRSSPWHVAPLHLPQVGQNCWPHMASGFSASMWLRVAELEEKDGDKGKLQITPQEHFLLCVYKYETVLLVFLGESSPAAESLRASAPTGPKSEESLVHILSMGSKALMLQVWADFFTGSLTFR